MLILKIKHFAITLSIFISSSTVYAQPEVIKVNILPTIEQNLPVTSFRLRRALTRTELAFELQNLPNRRSFQELLSSSIGLELVRTPSAIKYTHDIIKLEPPISTLEFTVFTTNKRHQLCEVSENKLKEKTAAGIHGVKLYKTYFEPLFASINLVPNTEAVVKFVKLGRSDFGILPTPTLNSLKASQRESLFLCNQFVAEFRFHAHLHTKYKWAQKPIENLLRREFKN
ncbi:hypothetical protein A3762_02325 [Oleiphilus sp. HI0125]|nr:hypothetical protein A3762_02325 [Oleiphilus sp. HI0125]